MPEIGEIKIVTDPRKYIWVQCPVCKQERWIELNNFRRSGSTGMCLSCFNQSEKAELARIKARNSRLPHLIVQRKWKHREGYIRVRLSPDDFFYPMASKRGEVREHRLVMAKHLGRCLLPWEIVHHKGIKYPQGSKEDKGDNRLENLELLSGNKYHLIDSTTKAYIRKLERELAKLRG